ncbi:MAG: SDR family oxidoreductase [Sandaracinaceae bacterium]
MTTESNRDTVLVTGGSGFVGGWCIVELLRRGYAVRATLRSLTKEPAVRAAIETEVGDTSALSFVSADLASDAGWSEAMAGCRFVLHVASPIPAAAPKDPDELIVPARDGTLRVLRAARDAGVERVVITSSCGAVYYGHPPRTEAFDETSWTDLEGPGEMSAYVRSKAIAERAAWDFIAREGGALELATVNPVGIFGPTLDADASSSVELIARLLKGMPGCPRLYFAIVDVRDVADLHVRAMLDPAAKGERFIASAGPVMSMLDVAAILRRGAPNLAKRVPTRALPDWLIRGLALFDPKMRTLTPLLGVRRNASSAKAQRVLGWTPRPADDAIVATARSLAAHGLLGA